VIALPYSTSVAAITGMILLPPNGRRISYSYSSPAHNPTLLKMKCCQLRPLLCVAFGFK
jgi:hypothetical protein